MKKVFLFLFLAIFTIQAHAQKGDLFVGGVGGYITNYKDVVYGLNTSYHLSDPLEISLTGLINPNINYKDDIEGNADIKLYSANLDFRYYMILQRTWAMGVSLGGQYSYLNKKYTETQTNEEFSVNVAGFNIGWHMRCNLTENIKLNGGWRYTSANNDASHHLFYIGLGYTFNLY